MAFWTRVPNPYSMPFWIRIRIQCPSGFGSLFNALLDPNPYSMPFWIRIRNQCPSGSGFRSESRYCSLKANVFNNSVSVTNFLFKISQGCIQIRNWIRICVFRLAGSGSVKNEYGSESLKSKHLLLGTVHYGAHEK